MNARQGRAGPDGFLLVPVLVPAILLAAGNDDFGFDAPGLVDAYVYLGYFWHYPEHLWVFDDNSNYKISRLPWVLPGYVIHTLLGTIAGSYALAYLTMAGGSAALYLLLRDSLHDRPAASVVGVAWAGCTWAHGIGGWNYHMLAASAYYLTACWLIVRAARSPYVVSGVPPPPTAPARLVEARAAREGCRRAPVLTSLGAGAFLAASVHSYIVLVVFAPLVAFLYWAALPHGIERPVARGARTGLLVLCGGLLLTLALALVNRATGGAWLFFLPQLEAAVRYSQPGADIWWVTNVKDWLPSARYLVIPASLLVAGLAVLLERRTDQDRRMKVMFVALAWAGVAIMCWFQFVRRQVALDYSYHAFPIYLYAFPCLGAALTGRESRAILASSLAALAIVGTLLFLLPTPLPQAMDAISSATALDRFAAIVPPLVFALFGVSVMTFVRDRLRIVIFVSWFSVLNGWIAPDRSSYGVNTPGYRAQMIELFREADRFTTELDPSLIGIKYWLSDEQVANARGTVPLRAVFDSFVATRAWFTNLLGRVAPSPPIGRLTLDDLDRGVCIGVLSSTEAQDSTAKAIEARYAALGRPLRVVAARRFERPDLSFALTVLKPSPEGGVEASTSTPCAR